MSQPKAISTLAMIALLISPLLVLDVVHAEIPAQNTSTSYQYDANVTQITDPLGGVTTQSYDPLNRLVNQLQPPPVAADARPRKPQF
jgi:RHS Repeat